MGRWPESPYIWLGVAGCCAAFEVLVKSLVEWYAYMGMCLQSNNDEDITRPGCEIPRCLVECAGHVEAMFVVFYSNCMQPSNSFPCLWPVVTPRIQPFILEQLCTQYAGSTAVVGEPVASFLVHQKDFSLGLQTKGVFAEVKKQ